MRKEGIKFYWTILKRQFKAIVSRSKPKDNSLAILTLSFRAEKILIIGHKHCEGSLDIGKIRTIKDSAIQNCTWLSWEKKEIIDRLLINERKERLKRIIKYVKQRGGINGFQSIIMKKSSWLFKPLQYSISSFTAKSLLNITITKVRVISVSLLCFYKLLYWWMP
jgi:hypothetical protein